MKQRVTARAPINIALCKYWGKRDTKNILPFTDSISLTLQELYTETTVEYTPKSDFSVTMNGKELNKKDRQKIYNFCLLFAHDDTLNIHINTHNSGPTSAGLASSASGFSALAVALNEFYERQYDIDELTTITRKGSGSAVRSLLSGFVKWQRNGLIQKITDAPHDLVVIAVIINDQVKSISSRDAMKIGVETSPFFRTFVERNQEIANEMTQALTPFDFERVGELTEQSTALMHNVMKTSDPVIDYVSAESQAFLSAIKQFNNSKRKLFITMDAGPNIKIFTRKKDLDSVISYINTLGYKEYHILSPGDYARVIDDE